MKGHMYFQLSRYDVEVDPADGFDVLQLQIMSLCEVPSIDQRIFIEGHLGEVTQATDLHTALHDDCRIAVLRQSQNFLNEDWYGVSGPVSSAASHTDEPDQSMVELARTLMSDTCTRAFYGTVPAVQPIFGVPASSASAGTPTILCQACASTCVLPTNVAAVQVPADSTLRSTGVVCQCSARGPGQCLFEPRSGVDAALLRGPLGACIAETLRARFEQQSTESSFAAAVQHTTRSYPLQAEQIHAMAQRLQGIAAHVQLYRETSTLAAALATIPVALLCRRVYESQSDGSSWSRDFADELLHQLALWFKRDFFQWTNNMKCGACSSTNTTSVGGTRPDANERLGLAGVTEIHKCQDCGHHNRFPRYNHPGKLLQWRQGRCGEWANCFTLCCLALGMVARHVTDWTDHVWTEVWSNNANKWLHVDSCECAIDAPLLYESGWGKKLSYVIAAGVDDVVDVTRRYTKNMHEVLVRRTAVPEDALFKLVVALDKRQFETAYKSSSAKEVRKDLAHRRHVREQRQMEANIAYDDGARRAEESIGRISGSLLWRKERHELGGDGDAQAVAHHQGWRLLADAPPSDSASEFISLVCFGSQLLGLTSAGKLMWQSIPSSTGTLAAWKLVHVSHQEHSTNVAWPPADHRLLCIAAESKAMQFFVVSCRSESAWLWKVTYTAGAAGQPSGWIASRLHEFCLSNGPFSGEVSCSMVWSSGRLLFLTAGSLWAWPIATAEMQESAGKVSLQKVTHAEGRTALCASAGGAVLAFRGVTTPSATAEVSAQLSSVDVFRQAIACEPTKFTLGDDCGVSVVSPAVLPPNNLRLQAVFQTTKLRNDIKDDWLEIARVGQVAEASAAEAFDLIDSWPKGIASERQLAIAWPDARLPTQPGLYEYRYFNGPGFRTLAGTSQSPLLALPPDSCDATVEGWVPVFPADNITAMCCSVSHIIARTTSGEFWSIAIPPVLAHPPVTLQCAALVSQPTTVAATEIGPSVQARVGILFKQLTRGCGRSAGTCTNPHCAAYAGSVPLAPNAAAVEAIKLVSSGDVSVFCPK